MTKTFKPQLEQDEYYHELIQRKKVILAELESIKKELRPYQYQNPNVKHESTH